MKRLKKFFIVVADHDEKIFNILGPMDNDTDIINKVVRLQRNGRNVNCSTAGLNFKNKRDIIESYSSSRGYEYKDHSIIGDFSENSPYYSGELPQYAKKADRNKVVKILCKGSCRGERWAEMNVNFPGQDILADSDSGDFEARCLKCGKVAVDYYNWYR